MTRNGSRAMIATTLLLLVFAGLSGTTMIAQTKIEGVITGRSGSKIFLQTKDSAKVVVLLTDGTDVAQVQGLLKARKKEMSMAALIPGLPISVEGQSAACEDGKVQRQRFGTSSEDAGRIGRNKRDRRTE